MNAFEKAKRRYLIGKFMDLNVGQFEEMDSLTNQQLSDLIDDLSRAQRDDRLDLETEQGLITLQEIVEGYLD